MKTSVTLLVLTVLALASPGARAQEGQGNPFGKIDPSERITVNFKDTDLREVLDTFSNEYNLNIVTGPNVAGKVTMNLYEVPVKEVFDQVLASAGFTYTVENGFIVVQAAAGNGGGPGVAGANPYQPKVIFLNHVRAKDVVPMLTPLLEPDELIVQGPESKKGITDLDDLGGNEQATREVIVVFASDETLEKLHALLDKLDIPPLQVMVEATILQVVLSDDANLGVDFTAFGGIDFQAINAKTSVTDGITTKSKGGPQLQNWLVGLTQRGFTNPGSKGLHLGILHNQVGAFIEALEEVGNATILSNPKITTLNRHAAQVLVGQKLGYQTLTATETTTVQNIEFLEVGTSLVFRPFISEDGFVRMEIHPKKSDGTVSATTGLPEERTTEVSTNVLVRSGNTIVIGGLMETRETTNVSQVPFFGSIPLIGSLFRREETSEAKTEIIVLLTPHIVNQADLSRRADEGRRRLESAKAELAASHPGYLRPSYARSMYGEAATALADGDPEGALGKAEWGLLAMPADPDLAALAAYCRKELNAQREEKLELKEAIQLLDAKKKEQSQ